MVQIDYKSRSDLQKRVERIQRRGAKEACELGTLTVEFHKDFDVFTARVAHALRRRLYYRSDNGVFARGLVRYTGELQAIHRRNLRRQGSLQLATLVLDVTMLRIRSKVAEERWVVGIHFTENLKDFTYEGQVVRPSARVVADTNRRKAEGFIERALAAADSLGGKSGNRIRRWLNFAASLEYPASWNLWYYNEHFTFLYSDASDEWRERVRRQAIRVFPFKGKYPFSGSSRAIRRHPIKDHWMLRSSSDQQIRSALLRIDQDVLDSIQHVREYNAKFSSLTQSRLFTLFAQHIARLLQGRIARSGNEPSIYQFYER